MKKRLLFITLCALSVQCIYAQKNVPALYDERPTLNEKGEEHDKKTQAIPNSEDLMNALKLAKNRRNQRIESTPAFQSFTEKGPTNYPGRITTVLVDNVNGIYLAGTASGGLWKFTPDRTVLGTSQTNNTTWTKVNDFEISLAVVKIIQNPTTPNTIYYATSRGETNTGAGIFKSTDGGVTFSRLAATNPASNSDFSYIYSLDIHPVTQDIYVGMNGKVYVSKDAGSSFQKVYNDSNSGIVQSMFFNNNGAVLISVANRGVFRSPDGSANSFGLLTSGITNSTGLAAPYFYIKIAGCETQRNVIYALISGPSSSNYLDGIYKSTNGGDSWTKVNDSKSTVNYYQPYRAFVIAVKPSDPNVIVSAGVGAAFSSDGGMTWKKVYNIGIDHANAVWEKNSSAVYFICDQGMYFHISDATMDQYGNRADMTSNGMNNLQCYYGDYFINGDGVVFGAQDNQSCVIRKNSNLGYAYTGGDGFSVFTHKQDTNVVYGTVQYGSLYRCDSINSKISFPNVGSQNTVSMLDMTLDADQNGRLDEGHQFKTQLLVSESNSDNLFFPTDEKMYRSKNRGTNWNAISPKLDLYGSVMAFDEQPTAPILYYAIKNHVYRIQDALNTGVVAQEELAINLGFAEWVSQLKVDPNDHTKLYFMQTNSGIIPQAYIYRIDGASGTSPVKTSVSGDMPTYINNLAIYPGNSSIMFAATDIGVFYTMNGGANWNLVAEFPYVKVTDIKFHPITKKLYIFTFGRGAWIATLSPQIVTANINSTSTPDQEHHVMVYPSPTEDYIKIKTGNGGIESEVFVLNLNGRIMAHVQNYIEDSPISVHGFSSGLYLVKVKMDQGWRYETIVKK